ncbi:hypothetical protein HanRHA438_Chr07g0309171 [Helianthus annuus]|uniref:Uncharacterized protein n=1 Tax=Helianthus annuus TaxID=4232 RepID=A0A9K3IL48_HELAN|nr:hypothetical protein HanXRQr2_Chr07g0298891 [Helianthus annuus]KAJ0557218.1 hypothetical protein HanIR_Chr07g0322661 [Helianthus annuus]KAJ0905040.1 hypothetical protein HanPSC8_Chr07g0289391 [Helianthus annuus]KAJ0908325.1 hypothetical protein HanRHA438_Chr07g0309171 [Helianthus annuus]
MIDLPSQRNHFQTYKTPSVYYINRVSQAILNTIPFRTSSHLTNILSLKTAYLSEKSGRRRKYLKLAGAVRNPTELDSFVRTPLFTGDVPGTRRGLFSSTFGYRSRLSS